MIVPQYWAESRLQKRMGKSQVTLRRFGWSDESQAAAQTHADKRVNEAMEQIASGEKIRRRDPKVPYNGGDGLPIREEIISRQGETVITRNLYGALCLNHPGVLFADIDFNEKLSCLTTFLVFLAIAATTWSSGLPYGSFAQRAFFAFAVGGVLTPIVGPILEKGYKLVRGSAETQANRRIASFIRGNPDWHLRTYRTPAGLRVLAMHRVFSPNEPAVTEFFRTLVVDPIYARMCRNQQCFRARVSPKPWRIGISSHMKPSPGYWPIKPERLPDRLAWVATYEKAAEKYAACRFVKAMGNGPIDPTAQAVQILHDDLCRAGSGLPIA